MTISVMSSNCGAPPAKASMASKTRSMIAAAGSPAAREHVVQPRLAELLVADVLRIGHAVGKQHQRVARLEALLVSPYGRPGGSRPSGVPVDDKRHRPRPSARRTGCRRDRRRRTSRRRSAGTRSSSAAVTYFSARWTRYSSSLACAPAPAATAARPSSARSVACMLLIRSAAGRPLPETSATQSSTRSVPSVAGREARRSSRRRNAAPAGCARPGRSRPARGSAAGKRSAWMRAASSSSLSSFARATSVSLCSASSRSRSRAACDGALEQPRVLDRGRRLQRQRVEQLQLGGGVRHRQRAAERDDADDPLADLERRADQRRSVVSSAHPPRVGVDVVDDLADAGRGHRADDAVAARGSLEAPAARRRSRPRVAARRCPRRAA